MSQRYKTIFLGLKKNHPRNTAIVYPALFMVRRWLYVVSILMCVNYRMLGLYITLYASSIVFAYSLVEHPFEDYLLNW